MTTLHLTEHLPERGVSLTPDERRALQRLVPSMSISPSPNEEGKVDLIPSSYVGTVVVGDLHVHIRPKIGMSRVLYLLSHTVDGIDWHDDWIGLDVDDELTETVLAMFERSLRAALGRGVLRGYRREEDALPVVRGRIEVAEQIRRRQGRMPPVHVAFDDHTEDITANRLLRAALWRCQGLILRSSSLRQRLSRYERMLGDVSLIEFEAHNLPVVPIDRLNSHYSQALSLASLILRSISVEHRAGYRGAAAFIVDMNRAFEDFVVVALREELGLSPGSFPQGAEHKYLHLDVGDAIRLRPDLSWWSRGRCEFVGDVKYKKTKDSIVPNADVYQLLAYTIALDLSHGLLVYAAGEADDVTHVIRHLGKSLIVRSLDVGGSPAEIRAEIRRLASLVAELRTPSDRRESQMPKSGVHGLVMS